MGRIDDFGFEAESLDEWIQFFNEVFQTVLGEDVSLDPSTAIGRWVRQQGLVGAKFDEAIQWVSAGQNLFQASGRQLTDYATQHGIPFNEGTRSTVEVSLVGVVGTLIPAGSRMRTSAGAVFETTEALLIGSDGTGTVLARSLTIGAVQAAAGELSQIVTARSGWQSVTNVSAASLGREPESEQDWVNRFMRTVAIHSVSTNESIRARVADVDGVEEVIVLSNDTTSDRTERMFRQMANTYSVILTGSGANADIAEAIRQVAPPGIVSNGTVEETTADGVVRRWTVATETAIKITVITTIELGVFPADGRERMTQALLEYVSAQTIGQDLDENRLRAVLTDTAGHNITAFSVTLANDDPLTDTTAITLWTLEESNIDLTIEE